MRGGPVVSGHSTDVPTTFWSSPDTSQGSRGMFGRISLSPFIFTISRTAEILLTRKYSAGGAQWWLMILDTPPSKNLLNYCKMSVQMAGKPSQWVSHYRSTLYMLYISPVYSLPLYHYHTTVLAVVYCIVYSLELGFNKNWCRSRTCPTAGKMLRLVLCQDLWTAGKVYNFSVEFLQENRNMSGQCISDCAKLQCSNSTWVC